MRLWPLLTAMFLAAPAAAADHYEFDKEHTTILFFVNHLGFSDMVGLFTSYNGSFTFDAANPGQSTLDVTLRPSGIRTSSLALDHDLQGEKFFNSEQFPSIHFVSTHVVATGPHTGDVIGDLTLLGITKPATLNVHFNKAGYDPITQNFTAGFSAEATIKRSDFGMTSYASMVGDHVRLEVQTEGIDLDRKNAERIKH